MEVQGASTADGANIVQYDDWDGTNQQWQLVQVGGGPNPTPTPTPPPTGQLHQPDRVAGLRRWRHHPGGRRLLLFGLDDALFAGCADPAVLRPGALGVRGARGAVVGLRHNAYNMVGGRAYIKGIWASAFNYRKSNSTYYWLGCVEFNRTYVYTASAVDGTWSKKSKINNCYYDAGLLIDDNDTMYVAYGNTQLSVAQLSADGTSEVRHQQVFSTPSNIGTLEGSRFYKRGNYYYIWATRPANGQYVLRSTSPWGPVRGAAGAAEHAHPGRRRRRAAPGRSRADPERRLVLHGVRRRLPRRPDPGHGADQLEFATAGPASRPSTAAGAPPTRTRTCPAPRARSSR